jgi:hypothetical protein
MMYALVIVGVDVGKVDTRGYTARGEGSCRGWNVKFLEADRVLGS